MSEHKESLVKVLEYLVNDEQDKAADLLHNVFVEKAKNHWAAITESDEVVEDEIQEDDLDEAIDVSDEEEDFLDDITSAEEEIEAEETMEADGEDDIDMDGDDAEMDLALDMEADDEAEEGPAAEAEEAFDNVEDAIAELRAAFADMMDDDEEADEEADDESMEMNFGEEVDGLDEAAALTAVNVSHTDGTDSTKSPVASNAKSDTGAKAHPTDTSEETGATAPAATDMGVDGPQDNGGKLSPARGMK